jgi:hypothetical protein
VALVEEVVQEVALVEQETLLPCLLLKVIMVGLEMVRQTHLLIVQQEVVG